MTPVADHALLVDFGGPICDETSARVLALDRALTTSPPNGMRECVPALVNLLIDFDPLVTDHEAMRKAVVGLLRAPVDDVASGRSRVVEVCYDEAMAPDLPSIARAVGISVERVIAHHLAARYRVRMYGFAPGYAYLSGVDPAIQVPRKATSQRDVPAGSVLIAGPQCLVTTLKMPTGWSVIGQSPTPILTEDPRSPVLFDIGDTVRFERIDLSRLAAARREVLHG